MRSAERTSQGQRERSPSARGRSGNNKHGTDSSFNRLAWSQPDVAPSGRGLIAAGMETGEVAVYDPVKILDGSDALFYSNQKHTGPVGGLNFNPIQKNLLLSGAINGEVSTHVGAGH